MDNVKKLKKTALTETTEEYAASSTIHGIGYIFDRELNIVDRLLWLFLVEQVDITANLLLHTCQIGGNIDR